jgi:MFS family permease
MELLYFTVAAIALYFVSDWIVDRIERAAGRRFEHRTLLFFAIILALGTGVFWLIRKLSGGS